MVKIWGCSKITYFFTFLMGRLSTKEVEACLVAFNLSGFEDKLEYNLCYHFSFLRWKGLQGACTSGALCVKTIHDGKQEDCSLSKVCFLDYKATFHCLSQGREKLSKGGAAIYAVVVQHMYKRKFCQTNLQVNKAANCLSKLMLGIADRTTVGEACH